MTADTVQPVRRKPPAMRLTVQEALRAQGRVLGSIPTSLRLSGDFLSRYPSGSDVSDVPEACGLLTKDELRLTSMEQDATEVRAQEMKRISLTVAASRCSGERSYLLGGGHNRLPQAGVHCPSSHHLCEELPPPKE